MGMKLEGEKTNNALPGGGNMSVYEPRHRRPREPESPVFQFLTFGRLQEIPDSLKGVCPPYFTSTIEFVGGLIGGETVLNNC